MEFDLSSKRRNVKVLVGLVKAHYCVEINVKCVIISDVRFLTNLQI